MGLARRLVLAAAVLAAAMPADAHHWPLLVQFNAPLHAAQAGYYVAHFQGFYDEVEIAVTLIPGGDGIDPAHQLGDGEVNVVVERMPAALAAREWSVPMVNIGQAFARPAMRLICWADSGIRTPADLRGRTIGVWSDDDRALAIAWLAGLGLKPGDATLVNQEHDPSLLLDRLVDCISAMSYDEEAQLVDAGVPLDQFAILTAEAFGPAPLEDGIWVRADLLTDPDMVWSFAAFLYATQRGWEWARANPVEAVRIIQEYDEAKTLEEKPQVRRMHEVNKLTEGAPVRLDPAAFEETVRLLLAAAPDGGITRPPESAWSMAPADEAGIGAPP
jgi:NitT/TauT family transport system substrate-binding protein